MAFLLQPFRTFERSGARLAFPGSVGTFGGLIFITRVTFYIKEQNIQTYPGRAGCIEPVLLLYFPPMLNGITLVLSFKPQIHCLTPFLFSPGFSEHPQSYFD